MVISKKKAALLSGRHGRDDGRVLWRDMHEKIAPPEARQKQDYRTDIDGLRAVAVLGVVAYHYGLNVISGGFVGVDIFFVISGFLITSHLKGEIEAGQFSILSFYDRRIRRIVPALLVMLAVTLIAGWFLLMPGDYASTGASAAYAAFGLGNIYFWQHTGYFDQTADMQTLLHTWSLGVEEQFYLVWPMLLFLGMTVVKSKRLFLALFAVLLVAAFAYATRKVGFDPKGAFYLPWPRAWELGIGGILAYLPAIKSRTWSIAADVVGIMLCLGTFLALKDTSPFPGLNAAYPCIGAALLLWTKNTASPVARGLSLMPLRWIGWISYSLYLWHWPVLVLFRNYNNGLMPSAEQAVLLAVLSVLLAAGSFYIVETPVRRMKPIRWRTIVAGLSCCALIAAPALAVDKSTGFKDRISPELAKTSAIDVMWQWNCPRPLKLPDLGQAFCNFGVPWDQATTKAFVWGDSHAAHLAPIIEAGASGLPDSFLLYLNCPASFGGAVNRVDPTLDPDYPGLCRRLRANAIAQLKGDPSINLVIFSASWEKLENTTITLNGERRDDLSRSEKIPLVLDGLSSLMDSLAAPGRRFIVVTDTPFSSESANSCGVAGAAGLLREVCRPSERYVASSEVKNEQESMTSALQTLESRPDTDVIVPVNSMCRGQYCVNDINGEYIYRDESHFRRNLLPETDKILADTIGISAALADPRK